MPDGWDTATLPVLANLLAKVRDGQLSLTGTDLEVEMVSRTAVDDAQDGEITIPAKGLVLYPAQVSASPTSVDLGTISFKQQVRASIALVSSGTTDLTIEPPAWLRRVDGSGRVLDAPLVREAHDEIAP